MRRVVFIDAVAFARSRRARARSDGGARGVDRSIESQRG